VDAEGQIIVVQRETTLVTEASEPPPNCSDNPPPGGCFGTAALYRSELWLRVMSPEGRVQSELDLTPEFGEHTYQKSGTLIEAGIDGSVTFSATYGLFGTSVPDGTAVLARVGYR
jgi:hypothetical protein